MNLPQLIDFNKYRDQYTDRCLLYRPPLATLTARKLDLAKSACFGDIWSSIRGDLRELHDSDDSDDYVTEKLNKQCYEDGPKAAARKHFRALLYDGYGGCFYDLTAVANFLRTANRRPVNAQRDIFIQHRSTLYVVL